METRLNILIRQFLKKIKPRENFLMEEITCCKILYLQCQVTLILKEIAHELNSNLSLKTILR